MHQEIAVAPVCAVVGSVDALAHGPHSHFAYLLLLSRVGKDRTALPSIVFCEYGNDYEDDPDLDA